VCIESRTHSKGVLKHTKGVLNTFKGVLKHTKACLRMCAHRMNIKKDGRDEQPSLGRGM
jgi:hypothetical protein